MTALYFGDPIACSYDGVTATGTYVSSLAGGRRVITLDGTAQTITVPATTITRLENP